jgi:hypothetical protein
VCTPVHASVEPRSWDDADRRGDGCAGAAVRESATGDRRGRHRDDAAAVRMSYTRYAHA